MSKIIDEIERTEQALKKKACKATEVIFNSNFSRIANVRVQKLIGKYPTDAPSSKNRKIVVRTEQDPKKILSWAIAQRVKRERMQKGLRQEDLAEMVGIKRPNIVRLEKGTHMPLISTLQKVALALNLEMGSLMTPPKKSAEDMREFTEMAEAGLSEWEKRLDEEDST